MKNNDLMDDLRKMMGEKTGQSYCSNCYNRMVKISENSSKCRSCNTYSSYLNVTVERD